MQATGNYVEYGTGNMLNIDVGTIKRKMDSNEYDGESQFEMQPNCKRTRNPWSGPFDSSMEVTMAPQTPNQQGSPWSKTGAVPMQHPQQQQQQQQHPSMFGFQTPDSIQPSVSTSPAQFVSNNMSMMMMDTSMAEDGPSTHSITTVTPLMPSAMPAGAAPTASTMSSAPVDSKQEYVPIHGRSMEIPSYARVPLNEIRKYREQRWSSCIYSADARIGQGMML
ncbi:hypothetical protein DFQ27_002424 [Actinomortierella ambigua]|uniref:Uncharacterized protein n=1 Tax=Actinomortierella ambigua TaxID=1343610 RepID=A0A9P6U697_9FUNG|nr:hypothetical protein DFQ27_002424 [Actinomortierella ambigua]